MHKSSLIAVALIAFAACDASAQSRGGTRFWNLTGVTLKDVRLAPAGSKAWGANQCTNDRDGEVDFDERLRITNTPAGRYDVQMKDVNGRICFARAVEVKDGQIFAVHERDLVDCTN